MSALRRAMAVSRIAGSAVARVIRVSSPQSVASVRERSPEVRSALTVESEVISLMSVVGAVMRCPVIFQSRLATESVASMTEASALMFPRLLMVREPAHCSLASFRARRSRELISPSTLQVKPSRDAVPSKVMPSSAPGLLESICPLTIPCDSCIAMSMPEYSCP